MLPLFAWTKVVSVSDISWFSDLSKKNIDEFIVCGDSSILPTVKSMRKKFLTGKTKNGYLLTNVMTYKKFVELMSTQPLAVVKKEFETRFSDSHLWKYTKENGFEDLGIPTSIITVARASIKDCLDNGQGNSLNDCSSKKGEARYKCCSEKMGNIDIYWGKNSEYLLMYFDSARLKVPKEKNHRYCSVHDLIKIK